MDANQTLDLELVMPGGVQFVRGSPTLSGTVYRRTTSGREPLSNVAIYYDLHCDDGGIDAWTATDAQGRYSLCKIPNAFACLMAFPNSGGFESRNVQIATDTILDIDFDVDPPPPANIDGTYTLDFQTNCPALPAELRRRSYTATISGSPRPLVTLSGATFWRHPNGTVLNTFRGDVDRDNRVVFMLAAPSAPSFGIVEQVGTSLLEVLGNGAGVIDGSTIDVTLSVGIGFGEDLRDEGRHVGCGLTGHRASLRFTRVG